MHDDCMLFSQLVIVPRLIEFVYSVVNTTGGSRKRLADETTRVLVDLSTLVANTRGTTSQKDKGKGKGKGKVVEPERLEFIPL